ncbi:MAG: porin family protein [Bacteroidales bacterium]|nr:porin family protein [Bacteroidales bacterium]
MHLRKINIILLLLFTGVFFVHAQKEKVKNQPYIDNRLIHLGFFVGMHIQDMVLRNSGYVAENGESWFAEIPSYAPGFSVGLISDLYLNRYMSLRFSPLLAFGEKKFSYKEANSEQTFSTQVRSTYLTLPIDLRLNSMRLNNYRPYILAGVYGAFDLGRKKDQPILLKGTDFGIQIGLGCDFYMPLFKFCPEIRFSFGLLDLIEKDRSGIQDKQNLKYTEALSSGKSRMISLIFNFE